LNEREAFTQQIVRDLERAAGRAQYPIPVHINNARLRVTQDHWAALAPGSRMPAGAVAIAGPKGRLAAVSVQKSFRTRTQVVVTREEAQVLGIDAPLRATGTCNGAGTVRIVGPRGEVTLSGSVICSQRRVQFSPSDAAKIGVSDGDSLRVRVSGPRGLVFEDVLCRVAEGFELSFHIDTDEAASAWLSTGDMVHLV
jgi:propanediol utilization protein